MSSREVYHRITHTQNSTPIGNTSGAQITLQMPTSRSGNALWELVSFSYRRTAGAANTAAFSLGEVSGFAPNSPSSVFESEAIAKTAPFFHPLDLAGVDQNMQRGMIIASPDADSKLYLHATFAGGASAGNTDHTFTLKLTFRQLKGSNIAVDL